jgi:hypothetical protein
MAPVTVEPCAQTMEDQSKSCEAPGMGTENIVHKTREPETISPVEHCTLDRKPVPERIVKGHQKRQRLLLR